MPESQQRKRERLAAAGCLHRAAPMASFGTPREVAVVQDCLELLWHLDDTARGIVAQTAPLRERIAALVSEAGPLEEDWSDSGLVGGVLELADYALGLIDGEEPNPLMVAYRTEEVWTLFDRLLGEEIVWYDREVALQSQVAAALEAGADADGVRVITHDRGALGTAMAEIARRHGWAVPPPPAA